MIKNGRPDTVEGRWEDHLLMDELPSSEQDVVYSWIKDNFIPRKTALRNRTSYGLKHIIQSKLGIYLTNNQFKDAMMKCGFNPVNPNSENWVFGISKNSPAFLK